jgi:transposase
MSTIGITDISRITKSDVIYDATDYLKHKPKRKAKRTKRITIDKEYLKKIISLLLTDGINSKQQVIKELQELLKSIQD